MARTRSYAQAAVFGYGPVSEFATGGGMIGVAGFTPMVPSAPMADAPAAAAFTGLTFNSLTTGASFWRTEAAGFLYFLALAILLNRRLVNR